MTIDDDLAAWIAGLDGLFALIAGRFFRVEPRLRARAYVRGLLEPLAAKNGWTLAEAAGDATPDGMQRLLNRAAWDDGGSATMCAPTWPGTWARRTACWWWMRPGSSRRGRSPPGCSGSIRARPGRVENCQLGVFCAYASSKGRALIDRELHLPSPGSRTGTGAVSCGPR